MTCSSEFSSSILPIAYSRHGVRTFEESVPARDRVAFEVQVPSHWSSSYQLMIDTFTQTYGESGLIDVATTLSPS